MPRRRSVLPQAMITFLIPCASLSILQDFDEECLRDLQAEGSAFQNESIPAISRCIGLVVGSGHRNLQFAERADPAAAGSFIGCFLLILFPELLLPVVEATKGDVILFTPLPSAHTAVVCILQQLLPNFDPVVIVLFHVKTSVTLFGYSLTEMWSRSKTPII